jgi:hypothetical protein
MHIIHDPQKECFIKFIPDIDLINKDIDLINKDIDLQQDKQQDKQLGLVLSCIDYIFTDKTMEFLKQDCCIDAFDHTILAGASLGFNQTEYTSWRLTLLNHIDLAIKLHDIKKIVVVDHENCGAYKIFHPDIVSNPLVEKKYHCLNIIQFIETIKSLYPHLLVVGFYLKKNFY